MENVNTVKLTGCCSPPPQPKIPYDTLTVVIMIIFL